MLNNEFDDKLYIDQVIPRTIQGEGKRIGYPSTLIRLSGCNLKCNFCDSKHTWTKHENNFIDEKTIDLFINRIKKFNTKNIMLTGGEPFLYSKNMLFWKLLDTFRNKLEIETNGTLITEEMSILLKKQTDCQINLSPKLNINFYNDKEQYHNIFDTYIQIINTLDPNNYIIKFVYHKDCWDEIKQFIIFTGCEQNIYLMARTPDINKYKNNITQFEIDYKKSTQDTVKRCIEENLNFSPREHINIFGFDKHEHLNF